MRSDGVSQTLVTGIGQFATAATAALAIILISRTMGPELFGEFSAGFSLALIASRLNDAGITIATQKFASKSQVKSQVKSYILYGYKLKFILTLLLASVFLIISPFLTKKLGFSHPLIVPISLIMGLSLTYFDQLTAGLLATHMFFKAALANILQATIKLIGAMLFSFIFPISLLPILTLFVSAPIIPLLLKPFFEPKWFATNQGNVLTLKNKKAFKNLAKHTALLVFVMGVVDSIGILFVKMFVDSYQTGLLGGISRIALLFTLIGVSLGQVLNNRVSRYSKRSDLNSYIKKSFLLALASIFTFVLSIPFLPLIVSLSIGNEYLQAMQPLIVLLASVFIYIMSVPFTALFYSFDKNS